MEAKAIYNATRYLLAKVRWRHEGGNEWFRIGEASDFRIAEATARLMEHFSDSEALYLVLNRRDVRSILTSEAAELARRHLHMQDLLFVDEKLLRFFEISQTGVARCGVIDKNSPPSPNGSAMTARLH